MIVCPVCNSEPTPVPEAVLTDGSNAGLRRCRCRRLRLSRISFVFSTGGEGGPQDQISVNYREAALSSKPIFMWQSGRDYWEAKEEDVERMIRSSLAGEVLES